MTRRRRIFLIVTAVIALLVGVGTAVLILAFPAERVGALAAERVSQALDRDVTIGRARLALFPVPAVALEGVRVERWRNSGERERSTATTDDRPLAEIRRIEVRPRLLPLFRRELIVSGLVIDGPSILVEVEDDAEPVTERVADGSAGFLDDASFDIRRIRVRDARVEYIDRATGTAARLEGVDQDLRLEGVFEAGSLARIGLRGGTVVERLSAELAESLGIPFRDVPLTIEHDGVIDLIGRSARVERLVVALGELRLEGDGTVTAWSNPAARRVSLRLASDDADLTGLLALLPDSLRSWPAGADAGEEWGVADGRASIRAAVEGPLGEGRLPAVDGRLRMEGIALNRGMEAILTDLNGTLDFSLEELSADGLTARLLGEPLRLALTVRDTEEMQTTGSLSTRLDLARAVSAGLLPEGWKGRGAPGVDLTFRGPLARPIEMAVDGSVALAGVEIEGPEWPGRLTITGGSIGLAGQEVVGRRLAAEIAGSDATLDFALADWVPFALGDEEMPPRLVFESHSTFVDADALFPPDPDVPTYAELFFARLAGAEVNGMTASEAAEAAGLRLPEVPPVVMEGQVAIDRLTQRGGEFQDIRVDVGARDRQLELRGADFTMLGGGIHLAGRLGRAPEGVAADSARQPLLVDFAVRDVSSDPFFQRFTAFRDHLAGTLGIEGSLAMELDRNLLPEPVTVHGVGDVSIRGGQLVNWGILRALGGELGIAQFDTVAFQDWTGRFELVGSRIVLHETELQGGEVGARVAGSFDVSGQLDLAGTLFLPQSLTSRASGTTASALVTAATDESGRVPVGIRFAGTARQPSVSLDLTEAGRLMAERAREEAETRARELAESAASAAASRVLGSEGVSLPESPGAALETARQSASDAVIGRLRGLIGGGAGPASDRPEAAPEESAQDSAQVSPAGEDGGEGEAGDSGQDGEQAEDGEEDSSSSA